MGQSRKKHGWPNHIGRSRIGVGAGFWACVGAGFTVGAGFWACGGAGFTVGAGFRVCVSARGVVDFWAFPWNSPPLDRAALDRPSLDCPCSLFFVSSRHKCRSCGLLVPFGFPEKPKRTISVVLEPRTEKQMAKCGGRKRSDKCWAPTLRAPNLLGPGGSQGPTNLERPKSNTSQIGPTRTKK